MDARYTCPSHSPRVRCLVASMRPRPPVSHRSSKLGWISASPSYRGGGDGPRERKGLAQAT